MKRFTPVRLVATLAVALAFPAFAHAHSGQALVYDCASGIAHPLHGWDHLIAMIAVGLWAVQLGGRARWLVPATFVTVMACSARLGSRGIIFPGVELMIATSVLALGVLIAAMARMPLFASVAIVTFFAAIHGFAHGAEMRVGVNLFSYAVGFVIATSALHALGLALGQIANRKSQLLFRAIGAGCAAIGIALLAM
jgi:urease accessory protein